jgi:hypothetical protein
MSRFAIIMLAACALAPPALSAAGDKSTDSRAKPSSFVPHAQTDSHVYGSPIGPAVVGHPKSPQYQTPHRQTPRHQTPKKRTAASRKQG